VIPTGLHQAQLPARCVVGLEYNTGIQKPFRLASEQMDSDAVSTGTT
jgi:hypothetical protein